MLLLRSLSLNELPKTPTWPMTLPKALSRPFIPSASTSGERHGTIGAPPPGGLGVVHIPSRSKPMPDHAPPAPNNTRRTAKTLVDPMLFASPAGSDGTIAKSQPAPASRVR
ncbi:MAG: hypothetical protein U0269_10330 [Polyangiales bacterium]